MKDIEFLLRHEAPAIPPPQGLEQRITATLRAPSPKSQRSTGVPPVSPSPRATARKPLLRWLVPPAIAAIAAAVAIAVIAVIAPPDHSAPEPERSAHMVPPPVPLDQPASFPISDLALENPLRSEARALEDGVVRTGRFLIRALPDPEGFR